MDNVNEKKLVFDGESVVCPECGEELTPADVETYARCPYCDCKIERDSRFDDFVIAPLVKGWMKNAHRQFPG